LNTANICDFRLIDRDAARAGAFRLGRSKARPNSTRGEYGWTKPFEGLYAQIVAAERGRYFIAEVDGANVGALFWSRIPKRSRELGPAGGEQTLNPYTVAPLAFGRRKCSSSRGMISTKLHGP
jgi:hypothetical protein